jgi:hypothetical protein
MYNKVIHLTLGITLSTQLFYNRNKRESMKPWQTSLNKAPSKGGENEQGERTQV